MGQMHICFIFYYFGRKLQDYYAAQRCIHWFEKQVPELDEIIE